MGIEELDFERASEHERRAVFAVLTAWAAEAFPEEDEPSYAAWVSRQQTPEQGYLPPRLLVAREGNQVIGYLSFRRSEQEENAHVVLVHQIVLQEWRRRGIGTALLSAALPLVPDATVAESWHPHAGTDGEAFALARGFQIANAMTLQRLNLTELPAVGATPTGYELVSWTGEAPEELLGAYVDALNAMKDAPFGRTALDTAHYTAENVRREEAAILSTGAQLWGVFALHGGEVAGLTVLQQLPSQPNQAFQRETVVVPAHRGKGLGRLIKARMLHHITGIDRIGTRTSSHNEHMLRVNHALGFVDRHTYLVVNAKIADLKL